MFLHLSVYSGGVCLQGGSASGVEVGQTAPPKLEKRAVRILLEHFLVSNCLLISSTNYLIPNLHTVILCIKYLVFIHLFLNFILHVEVVNGTFRAQEDGNFLCTFRSVREQTDASDDAK